MARPGLKGLPIFVHDYSHPVAFLAQEDRSWCGQLRVMKTPKRRGLSPRTEHFTALDIMSAWEPLLEMRSPGFEWDGSSAIPDELYGLPTGVAKCIVYKIPLDKLVDLANIGFPAHNDLSSCTVWRADQCVSGSCVVAVLGETSIDCRWRFSVEINSDLGLQRGRLRFGSQWPSARVLPSQFGARR